MALTRECFTKIIDLLTPFMQDEQMRQAILQPALFGTPLLNQIVFSGNAQAFTVMLVKRLDDYGRVTEDKTAIAAVLEAVQGHVGWDKQAEIKELIACAEGRDPATPVDAVPDLPQPSNSEAREQLFISYSSTDRVSFVDRLAKDLTGAGHKIWVDNLDAQYGGITGGEPWQQALANALHRAALVIFVIRPDSIRSRWAQAELKRAGEAGRPVIGVVARPLKTDEDKRLLAEIKVAGQSLTDLHYRDFTVTGYDRGLEELKSDITRQLQS